MSDKNGGRNIKPNLREFMDLLPFDDIPTFGQLTKSIDGRADRIRGDDRSLVQRQLDLFGPEFTDWDGIAAAVLDDRELPIPAELLPTSREETLLCLENLVDRHRKGDLVDIVTKSWDIDFERFVDRLWHTAADDRPFFDAAISGRHKSAFFYMRDVRIPLGHTPATALSLIARMGLLWCAHDVQLTAARLRRAARKPMGSFLFGEAKLMGVATAHAIGRRFFSLMSTALDVYCTDEELANGKRPPRVIGRALEILRIRRHAMDIGVPPESGPAKKKLDALVVATRNYVRTASDRWWDEIKLKKASGAYTRMKFSQLWWSDLDGLQPLAVSTLRFLQAEAMMDDLVFETYRTVNPRCRSLHDSKNRLHNRGDRLIGFLPAFDKADLAKGWVDRAKLMIAGYRHAILDDGSLQSGRRAKGDALDPYAEVGHDDTYLQPAADFLIARGQRGIADHHGDSQCARRTFYLLDVLLDVRLSR